MNPRLLEEGASGSSAGPGAATAAGLVAFSIGSETGGSIVSPAMRCGVTGLRPAYGTVARTGAMTLCWSLDKPGPMTRSVEGAMLVLQAISGLDPRDAASVPAKLDFDAGEPVRGLKIGYIPGWMAESPATDVDRAAPAVASALGLVPTPVTRRGHDRPRRAGAGKIGQAGEPAAAGILSARGNQRARPASDTVQASGGAWP